MHKNSVSTHITRRHFVKLSAALAGTAACAQLPFVAAAQAKGTAVFSKAGTYKATAAGRNGEVELEATFSDSAIKSIKVTKSSETTTIGGQAMDMLIKTVLDNQSIAVDTVSGATFSSNAFVTAVKDCVEQAGASADDVSDPIKAETVDYAEGADIVIVGAGGAGLTAALTAIESGMSVILLEKDDIVGGNTNAAVSGINVAGSKVQEDLGADATIDALVKQQTNDLARPELVQAFADASGETADWLAGLGVEFTLDDKNALQLRATSDNANTGNTLVDVIYKTLQQQKGFSLYTAVEATDLIVDKDGSVCGVTATDEDGAEHSFSASAVILTCGGYGKNHDMVVGYAPEYENTTTDEIAPTTGDGIFMTEELGATPVDTDQFSFFRNCIPGYSMLFPNLVPGSKDAPAGIFVNSDGERFVNEASMTPDDMLAQPDGLIYHIFPVTSANDAMNTIAATGFVKQADSVADLADQLGIDADALQATIDEWNKGAAEGKDDKFGRDDEGVAVIEGSLMGYTFQMAVHYCMGGLLIDTTTHVVDGDGNPISGLYAAGEVTGGFHGNTRVDGSGLADSFVFGRLAGNTASQEVQA